MSKVLWLVSMNFNQPEKEAEFNHWYNNIHLPEVLTSPGIVGATRYRATREVAGQRRYLSVYEFPNQEVLEAFNASPSMASARKDFQTNWRHYTSDFLSWWFEVIEP
ncbi:MAG: hypothetical protein HYU86_12155 [Chloroflexi bacterium]|nr:hypothetical protein [Chloroflexota bacterium]